MNTYSKVTKCSHSVYLATASEVQTKRSLNCSLCTPSVDNDVIDVVRVIIGQLMRARRAVQIAANRRVGAKRMLRTKRRKAALLQRGGAR